MNKKDQPKQIYLKDYKKPSHRIHKTYLYVDIYDDYTTVLSELHVESCNDSRGVLSLDGQDLVLESVEVDGVTLSSDAYTLTDENLILNDITQRHIIKVRTRIFPQKNTSLEGLYASRVMLCTQCEAQGFRKITYYLDRPDVMSEFTTTITAEKEKHPVLLSNGNAVESGEEGTRHWVRWHDPHLKPCYLFAMVAGSLSHKDDYFTTMSGRKVLLRIFVEEKDLDKCDHAMLSLKNAMRWDEEVYGREYDLDIFMIVAVDDFNMGAMENKGLNIFNTSCVLANPLTTTDAEFQRVEGVVAHEYFHNWSGNRVTCRDWFQLSLKEGFTVFRDAEFSADMGSRTVKRVEDVSLLRSLQFSEDAGPMAHAVQPDSFIEISNFYTLTIYEKGAEIVRMIHTLLGSEAFRKGSDLYFERHDGQAVTINDFVTCMEEVSHRDLSQFMLWYKQAGTPKLHISCDYDSDAQRLTVNAKQSCRATAECVDKKPFLIPISIALLGDKGKLPLYVDANHRQDNDEIVLEMTDESQSFTFYNVEQKPVPSLLRSFSAPVKLDYRYSEADLLCIMQNDDDGYSRWNASQQLAISEIQRVMVSLTSDPSPSINPALIDTYRQLLQSVTADNTLDKAMLALMLTLPSEKYLGELASTIDVESIHHARKCVERKLSVALKEDFLAVYKHCLSDAPYSATSEAVAQRALKNCALHYLAIEGSEGSIELISEQFTRAENMTDELAAFRAIVHSTKPKVAELKQRALKQFYDKWQHEPLVVNHWFSVQATMPLPQTLDTVIHLMTHERFDFNNPNKLRSLLGAFCHGNTINFHAGSGRGYQFLAEQILKLNTINPQVASRMLTPLTKWQRYDEKRGALMREALSTIRSTPSLSKDVYEVVVKSLDVYG